MALIAPGAFLWLTFFIQATTGTTSPAMWIGIFAALLLCLATAVAYAEISKLYPGTGSSYYYAEQALLSKDKAFKYARAGGGTLLDLCRLDRIQRRGRFHGCQPGHQRDSDLRAARLQRIGNRLSRQPSGGHGCLPV